MKKQITKAVIPAAGLGTRLLPATIAQPKEMLIIVDKPVIQYVVEEAVAAGIKDILIVTGRNKRAVEDHFDPSYELEDTLQKKGKLEELKSLEKISKLANIHFIRQKKQLGLADAIYQGKYFVGGEPFAVLLGDTIISSNKEKPCLADMLDIFCETGKSVVAAEYVKRKKDVERYGIIDYDKKVLMLKNGINYHAIRGLVEKPSEGKAPSRLAIASRYIFTPDIFGLIEKTKPGKNNEIQITDSMQLLLQQDSMMAYQIDGRRYDIGDRIDYIKTTIDFALKNEETRSEIYKHILSFCKTND